MASTEQIGETADKRDERETTLKAEEPVVTGTPQPEIDDEDSDWEDLDEVLDDFSGPKRSTKPAASSKPLDTQTNAAGEAFIKQLEADMLAQLIVGEASGKGKAPAPSAKTTSNIEEPSLPDLIKKLQGMSEQEAAEFEENMEKEGGMQNLFKNLLGSEGAGAGSSESAFASAGVTGESFSDTIQKTLERMQESGEKITTEAKTSQDKLIDASIARFLEMADGTAGNGGNLDLEQVFNDVIKEMSNKEMLYEPMKEYDAKYGPWLEENKATLSAEDYANYEKQAGVIKKIVETFESKEYSDDKPECLTSIWELMQQMEACGAPPSDLIKGSMGDGVLPSLAPFMDANVEDIDPSQIPPECNPQ